MVPAAIACAERHGRPGTELLNAVVVAETTIDELTLLERALARANDLGLFAEEYDGTHRRMIGNFPQAFSHLGLIGAVDALAAG